jgi:hypothetical protein
MAKPTAMTAIATTRRAMPDDCRVWQSFGRLLRSIQNPASRVSMARFLGCGMQRTQDARREHEPTFLHAHFFIAPILPDPDGRKQHGLRRRPRYSLARPGG